MLDESSREREREGEEEKEGIAWLSTSARRVRKTSRMTIDHPSPRNEHQRVHWKVDVLRKVDDPCLNRDLTFKMRKRRRIGRVLDDG